jgi:hypothetical protein
MSDQAVANPVAPQTGGTPPPIDANAPKPGEKVYEIKYPDGRTEKRGESWLLERAQKSIGLEKRVTDASKYEQAFNTFVSKVQDPTQLVELLNHPDLKYDEDKQAALITSALGSKKPKVIEAVKRWIYENEVQPSLMDPKDRAIMEKDKKLAEFESEKEKATREREEQESIQKVAQVKASYQKALGEAYKTSGLPVDDYLVRQVMEKARLYVRAGKQPDFANCCKLVQGDFINQVKSVLGSATVENILGLMDGETPQKINKALMKALEKKEPEKVTTAVPKSKRREKEKTPQEKKQWLRNLERGIID